MIYLDCRECVAGMKVAVQADGRDYITRSVSGRNEEKVCREILGYSCSLVSWADRDLVKDVLGLENFEFLRSEFKEWIDPEVGNPGHAWERDPETWKPFLTEKGKFTYTYNNRFNLKDQEGQANDSPSQFNNALECLSRDPFTRQAFIGIWNPYFDSANTLKSGPEGRVPCTLGYHFLIRPWGDEEYHLEMIYSMRSLCVSWNLWNDLWLVTNLFDWFRDRLIASNIKIEGQPLAKDGQIHFHVGSLHSFKEKER